MKTITRRKIRKLRVDTLSPKSARWVSDLEKKLFPERKTNAEQPKKQVLTREDLNNLQVTETELEASICKSSFYEFVKAMWPAVSAETPVWNWHIKYLCDQIQEMVEKIFKGIPRDKDLVVNISPGTTKSTIMSVMLPAWCWTRMPTFQFIGVSYTEKLAIDLSLKCRDVVRCDLYRRLFPEIVWRSDQDMKCLAEGTEVLMADGTLRNIEMIKEGDVVQSSDGRLVKNDVVEAIENTGVQPVYEIVLCDGTRIKATENHRLFGEYDWVFVRDMKPGQLLRVVKETKNQNGDLSRDDAFLLALWLAEGTKRATGFRVTIGEHNAELRQRLEEVCNNKGWVLKNTGTSYSVSCGRLRYGDTPANFLRRFGLYMNQRTHRIRIPVEVMQADIGSVREFLGTYLSCDGCVNLCANDITICSVSRRMIKDLSILFKRIGVQGIIRQNRGRYNKEGVSVLCRMAYTFCIKRTLSVIRTQQLLVYGESKMNKHEELIQRKKNWLHNRRDNKGNRDEQLLIPGSECLEYRMIKSITELPPVQTYDIQTRYFNAFFAEGVLSHNSYFKNTIGGWRYCTGTGGTVTGYHAHLIVIDDPINPNEAVSELELATANRWLTETLSSRKVNKKVSLTILVMQRLHQDDPSAQFLRRTDVRHICLPAEITDDVFPPELRDMYGKGLFDQERMPRSVLSQEKAKGSYYYASQFLQTPIPLGGGMFKVHRVRPKPLPDEKSFVLKCRYWDKAATQGGTGAYTVGVLMARDMEGKFWVLDVIRVRLDSGEREAKIKETAILDGLDVIIGLEQEPGSGGKDSTVDTVRRLAGWRVRVQKVDKSTGGKELRADPWSVQVNYGNVYCDQTLFYGQFGTKNSGWLDWLKEFWDEHQYFPNSKYKDQVDAASGAFSILAEGQVLVGPVED